MKRFITLIVAIFIILHFSSDVFSEGLEISSESAILIDADTGEILYEKDPYKKMYPASTTKILTAILAIENGNLDDIVTVDKNSPFEVKGSHIALDVGEKLTLRDLLNGLLLESANDCALVIAKHISGSYEEFIKLMNDKAKEIGAKNSNFVNPHGLHDPNHYSSAYDLSLIAKYAMENDIFKEIVSKKREVIKPTNKQPEVRYLINGNKLLYAKGNGNKINVDGKWVDIKYEGVNGVKTGYTDKAMNCLVSSATRGGQNLIAVVLKSPKKAIWIDTHKLLNYGFNNFESRQVAFKREFVKNINVENGTLPIVTGIIDEDIFVNIRKGDLDKITKEIIVSDKISAPVSIGQVIGKIEYKLNGKVLATANIVAATKSNLTPIKKVVVKANDRFKLYYLKWFTIFLIIIFIIFRIYILILKRKRRKKRRKEKYYS